MYMFSIAVCLMLYADWPRIGSMTETGKIKLPRSLVRLTTLSDNVCEFLLERLYTFCINHGLRQIIIYIHHCENGSEEKCTFVCDFWFVAIQLFVVTVVPCCVEACRSPGQESLEAFVTYPKHMLVEYAQHCDAASQHGRSKVVF